MARKHRNILTGDSKVGDVLFVKTKRSKNEYIFRCIPTMGILTNSSVALCNDGDLIINDNIITYNADVAELRYATKEERQKLIDALRKHGTIIAKEHLVALGVE